MSDFGDPRGAQPGFPGRANIFGVRAFQNHDLYGFFESLQTRPTRTFQAFSDTEALHPHFLNPGQSPMIYQTLQNTGGAIALSGSDTFDNRGIIVLRTSTTGVRALSRNCTHAGFTVNINSAANNLVCPSHNSIFDLNGNVVSGPASGALTRYSASLSGSIITISQGS